MDLGILTISISLAIVIHVISSIHVVDGRGEDSLQRYIMVYGVRLSDLINPVKWFSFLRGKFISIFVSVEYMQQLMLRAYLCSICVEKGKCVDCNCDTWAKMLDPYATCSAGKWGAMYKHKRWHEVVKEFGISYIFKFNKTKNG